jgi:hypothetical protein
MGTGKELSTPITGDDAHLVMVPPTAWSTPGLKSRPFIHTRRTPALSVPFAAYRSGVPQEPDCQLRQHQLHTSQLRREVTQLPDGRRQTFYTARKPEPAPVPDPALDPATSR